MLDKLTAAESRYELLMAEMADPAVQADTVRPEIAQAKRLIDTLHDALPSLPLLVIAGQIGMEPLCQVDVEPFRLDRLGRQPAARGGGYVRTARYTAAS